MENPYRSPQTPTEAEKPPRTKGRFWAYLFLLAPIPLGLAFWYWATNYAPGWFVAEGIGPHRATLVRGLARLHILAITILCHFPAFVLLAIRSTKYRWLCQPALPSSSCSIAGESSDDRIRTSAFIPAPLNLRPTSPLLLNPRRKI
jgi:hypothetical protein